MSEERTTTSGPSQDRERSGPRGDSRGGGGRGGRDRDRDRGRPGGRRGGGGGRRFSRRRKVCRFCVERVDLIDYKDVHRLQPFTGERGKILPRRLTGVCTLHQRQLRTAIKRARNCALMPFAAEI